MFVACSSTVCSCVCGRATHGLLLCGHWCTVGVHARTHLCALRCPSRMASGTQRQLSAVLVLRRRGTRIRQSGTVNFEICVLTAMKRPQFFNFLFSDFSLFSQFSAGFSKFFPVFHIFHIFLIFPNFLFFEYFSFFTFFPLFLTLFPLCLS